MATIPCLCPPRAGEQRHASDTVTLKPTFGFREAATVRNSIAFLYGEDADVSTAEILATLTEVYIVAGVESWTLVDEDGQSLPVTRSNIRSVLLANLEAASVVGDEADGLYTAAVMLPLLERMSRSSSDTPTGPSTSPTNGSSSTPPTPPKRSSTTTTPTGDIETTSPSLVGASN